MTQLPITHHEAEPEWIFLSHAVGKIPALRQVFLSSLRSSPLLPEMVSTASYDTGSASWNFSITASPSQLVFVDGRMKVFTVEKNTVTNLEALLKEEFGIAMLDVVNKLRHLVIARKIRIHGRKSKLQNYFENVPVDIFLTEDFEIDMLRCVGEFPDGDRYVSLHLEVLVSDDETSAGVEADQSPPIGGAKAGVDTLVRAMAAHAPNLLTRDQAAALLNTTQRARGFSRVWPAAIDKFNTLNLEILRPYRKGGRPPKSHAP